MSVSTLLLVVIATVMLAYFVGIIRSGQVARPLGGIRYLPALPSYYGMLTALWALIPSLLLLSIWMMFDDAIINAMVSEVLPITAKQLSAEKLGLIMSQVNNIEEGVIPLHVLGEEFIPAVEKLKHLKGISATLMPVLVIAVLFIGALLGFRLINNKFNARHSVERIFTVLLFLCSLIAIFTTIGIVFSVLFESMRFFQQVPFTDFLFGLEWSPQIAIRSDQVGASGAFGAVPLFVGTLLISFIAMMIAVPVGLMSAIYLAEYANKKVRSYVKPALEILAGVPTVVYGFFAALTVAPAIRGWGESIGLQVASESALAAGIVMGIMIIPFVSSLSDDVINAVPQSLRDGSYGMGATQSETIRKVIFPAALPGIVGGILLAVSRAIGETMIVVMAAGLAAKLTVNPLEAVTTVTVQIVTLLVGDQEFDSPKTLAAFALGLMLFFVTLALNFIALHVVKKYREQYD